MTDVQLDGLPNRADIDVCSIEGVLVDIEIKLYRTGAFTNKRVLEKGY